MRRLIAWMIAVIVFAGGYEFWGADQFGYPRAFPGPHPLVGSWETSDDAAPRTVEFRGDHSGVFVIPASGRTAGPVDLTFAWTTRGRIQDREAGHLQISFDRADFPGDERGDISAPCQYVVTPTSTEGAFSLVLDGNAECRAFWGEYH